MKKYKNTFIVIIVIVVTVAVIFSGAYRINEKAKTNAFESEISLYDTLGFDRCQSLEDSTVLRVYTLSEDNYGFIVKTEGYEGPILMYVTMDDEAITKVEILSQRETEGYGDYLIEPWFLKRLEVQTHLPLKVVKIRKEAPNEIVAITGATITTDAVVDGINACMIKRRSIQ